MLPLLFLLLLLLIFLLLFLLPLLFAPALTGRSRGAAAAAAAVRVGGGVLQQLLKLLYPRDRDQSGQRSGERGRGHSRHSKTTEGNAITHLAANGSIPKGEL